MKSPRAVKAVVASTVSLLVAAAVASHLFGLGSGDPIDSNPQPRLFPAALVAPLGDQLAAQKADADRAFADWTATHPKRDDAGFVAFALARTPAPPDATQRRQELSEVRALASSRTGAYVTASTWLELYGKSEIWKVYRHEYADVRPPQVGQDAKDELKNTRTLTKEVTAAAQAEFGLDAPFIADPSLRTDKQVTPGAHKLSYPSKHAVEAFSALTLLSSLEPLRTLEFTDMADQVAYSRLYMAGHYRSDLVAGAFLGYLIGDYEISHART